MKKTIKLSGLLLLLSTSIFAQVDNTSYRPNSALINGDQSVGIGVSSLLYNVGSQNTAVGMVSMQNNTTGSLNTAVGAVSLYSNITGDGNVAIGRIALFRNTHGDFNIGIGNNSLEFNTTGNYNIGIGDRANSSNSTGAYNIGVGVEALKKTTTGTNNIGIGQVSMSENVTGSLNSGFGMYANVSGGAQQMSTALGAFSTCNANYKVRIGANTVTVIEGQVPYSNPSDGRFKNNISETDVKGLEFIRQLRPVVYNFDTRKFQEFLTRNMPDSIRHEYLKNDFEASSAIRQSGFIAQEVEVAAQKCGYNFNGVHKPNDENDNYSIAYSQFVVPLVKGMQEQQKMIDQQQQEIDELKKLVKELAAKTTNTNSATLLNDISIYPNPNKGVFTINTNNIESGTIKILNTKGEQIQSIKIQDGIPYYQIDLTVHPKGIYLVNIQTTEGTCSKKIITQ